MGFRVVLVENEVDIQLKLDNLVVRKREGEIWIPINDISLLMIDNLKINISARMLCALAEHNVATVFCNQEHLPIGFYSSYDNYSRIAKNIGFQIQKTKGYYESLWKKIVCHKIRNQINVLKELNKGEKAIQALENYEKEVTDGDKTNREAHAAKVYFNELMGMSFSRGNEDILLNSELDYGYAVIRSYLAKLCVAYGLNTQLGIHHCNEYNRFNLVDDLIEPIRPIVDYFSYILLKDEDFFKGEHRRKLVNLLNHQIKYKEKTMYISNMLEEYVMDIAGMFAGKEKQIVFPCVDNYVKEKNEV